MNGKLAAASWIAFALAGLAWIGTAGAQTAGYPRKPIRFIVGFPPGGNIGGQIQ